MPLFTTEGLESCNITYTVEAATLHRGQRITEDHYTALLPQVKLSSAMMVLRPGHCSHDQLFGRGTAISLVKCTF